MKRNHLRGSYFRLRGCHVSWESEIEKKPDKGQCGWISVGEGKLVRLAVARSTGLWRTWVRTQLDFSKLLEKRDGAMNGCPLWHGSEVPAQGTLREWNKYGRLTPSIQISDLPSVPFPHIIGTLWVDVIIDIFTDGGFFSCRNYDWTIWGKKISTDWKWSMCQMLFCIIKKNNNLVLKYQFVLKFTGHKWWISQLELIGSSTQIKKENVANIQGTSLYPLATTIPSPCHG